MKGKINIIQSLFDKLAGSPTQIGREAYWMINRNDIQAVIADYDNGTFVIEYLKDEADYSKDAISYVKNYIHREYGLVFTG